MSKTINEISTQLTYLITSIYPTMQFYIGDWEKTELYPFVSITPVTIENDTDSNDEKAENIKFSVKLIKDVIILTAENGTKTKDYNSTFEYVRTAVNAIKNAFSYDQILNITIDKTIQLLRYTEGQIEVAGAEINITIEN